MYAETTITPNRNWGGAGLAGINVRMSNITKAVTMVWHVVLVHPNGPASAAGLESGSDFVIGVPGFMFFHADDFYNQVKVNLNKPLPMYVYSTKTKTVRIVTVTPDHNWGGNGFLGCDVAYGLNHQLVTALTTPPASSTPDLEPTKLPAPTASVVASPSAPPKPAPVAAPSVPQDAQAIPAASTVLSKASPVTRAARASGQVPHHHAHDGPCNHDHSHDHSHDHHSHDHSHDHSQDHDHDHSHEGHNHGHNETHVHKHGEHCNHDHSHGNDHSHAHEGHQHKNGAWDHDHDHQHETIVNTQHTAAAAPHTPTKPAVAPQQQASAPSTPSNVLQQVSIDYQPSQLFSPFNKLPGHYYATPLPEELNNGEEISFQARFGN